MSLGDCEALTSAQSLLASAHGEQNLMQNRINASLQRRGVNTPSGFTHQRVPPHGNIFGAAQLSHGGL